MEARPRPGPRAEGRSENHEAAGAGPFGAAHEQAATLFPLGAVVATAGAVAEVPILAIHAALDRHAAGDWGDLPEEDRLANGRALAEGERLLSSYETVGGVTFWVVTERDRSVTTVLLPEDY